VTLHMNGGDDSYNSTQSHADFVRTYKRLTAYAAHLNITLHLRVGAQQGFGWGFHRTEASLFPKPPHNLSAGAKKRICGSHCILETDHFAKTGSGQT
jgi:hypothetical protein